MDGHGDETGDGVKQPGSYEGMIFNLLPGHIPCWRRKSKLSKVFYNFSAIFLPKSLRLVAKIYE